jgi:hypothetical protein
MAVLRRSAPAALLALLLLGACDSDAAHLAKEITDARGDCTQEKLKAGDEACVEMMEKYAAIGTSAIETYIGAVKSMDEALQRMPPANFDTTGFGHALTPPSAASGAADSRGAFEGWSAGSAGGRDRRGDPDRGSGYDPYDPDPRYADPRYADPRNPDPRDPASGYAEPGGRDPGERDPRDRDPGERDRRDAGRGDPEPRGAARRAPGRGLLLPPEERLERPWLRAPEEAAPRETPDRASTRPRAERTDGYLPSRPLPADTLGPYDDDRPRTRRPAGY